MMPNMARRSKSMWGGAREGAGRKPVLRTARSVTFSMEADDVEALQAIAAERGISTATLLRDAVRAHLERQRRRSR